MESNSSATSSCTIVGGGITGLVAGTVLQRNGINVTILDKGRGSGGRLASRRIVHPRYGEGVFDYGMQYFTVSDARFQIWVDEWLQQGVVSEWSKQFDELGTPCYRGTKSSRSIAQHLATNLDIRTQTCAIELSWESSGWHVRTENGDRFQGNSLLITSPMPQTLALLDNSAIALPLELRNRLERVTYRPCITVLALLAKPSSIPPPGGLRPNDASLAWIACNRQKGISPLGNAVTLHASPEFSQTHWQTADSVIADILCDRAATWLGATVVEYQIQRWLYSQPQTFYDGSYLALQAPGLLVMAGDVFRATPTVAPSLHLETAARSGLAAANYLLGKLAIDR